MNRLIIVLFALWAGSAVAHQPIMDMAPRWNNGYGFQTRLEHANNDSTTWVEGVYTFKPSVRVTLKLPFNNGELGNALLAVPLKRYHNDGAFTSNWSFTPSIRLPTGANNAATSVSGKSQGDDWDLGFSVSYSSETPTNYQLYDLYTLGGNTGLDINVGRVFASGKGSSWFTLWDISALDSDTGQRVLSGPVVVYFRNNVVFRAEYKFPVHDNDTAWDGNFFGFGVGWVY